MHGWHVAMGCDKESGHGAGSTCWLWPRGMGCSPRVWQRTCRGAWYAATGCHMGSGHGGAYLCAIAGTTHASLTAALVAPCSHTSWPLPMQGAPRRPARRIPMHHAPPAAAWGDIVCGGRHAAAGYCVGSGCGGCAPPQGHVLQPVGTAHAPPPAPHVAPCFRMTRLSRAPPPHGPWGMACSCAGDMACRGRGGARLCGTGPGVQPQGAA